MDGDKQTTEVREKTEQVGDTEITKQSVATSDTAPSGVVAQQVVYYIGGAIILLLALRLVLALLGANRDNAFADFIFSFSGFFAWPFFGLFAYEPQAGVSTFELGTLVAIIVYGIVTVGIAKLFTLGSRQADV